MGRLSRITYHMTRVALDGGKGAGARQGSCRLTHAAIC